MFGIMRVPAGAAVNKTGGGSRYDWTVAPRCGHVSNHTNFLLPNTAVDGVGGGAIISAYDARIMQLGLRYLF